MLTWISVVGVLARIQLLRVISCWYVSCDDQQRALRDSKATKFCVQEPAVGFVWCKDESVILVCLYSNQWPLTILRRICCFPGFAAGRGYDQAGGAPGGG
ncbi:hypothetical protein F511_31296 [Dorcoceras hygrometricum]|uniref:Secreted protein n=1 Tax=Dorcoceras hygrometricum TaxID=472368 RepID=A0A2Z7AQH9_9LAMI|nr:hypothetical protein F511_31296 [Dorcoceras hygrometricum]